MGWSLVQRSRNECDASEFWFADGIPVTLRRKQRTVCAGVLTSYQYILQAGTVTVKVIALRVTNTCAVGLIQTTVMHVSTWTALSARMHNRRSPTREDRCYRMWRLAIGLQETKSQHTQGVTLGCGRKRLNGSQQRGGTLISGRQRLTSSAGSTIQNLPPYRSNRVSSSGPHEINKRLFSFNLRAEFRLYEIWYSGKGISNSSTTAAGSSNVLTCVRCWRYSCVCSWWWVGVPPETCRAVSRNK